MRVPLNVRVDQLRAELRTPEDPRLDGGEALDLEGRHNATEILTALLERSRRVSPLLNRAAVDALVTREVEQDGGGTTISADDLLAAHEVRFVLGEARVPFGVRLRSRETGHPDLKCRVLRAISTAAAMAHRYHVNEEDVRACCPERTLEALISGALERTNDPNMPGYFLALGGPWWAALGARALGRWWSRQEGTVAGRDGRFREWLHLACAIRDWWTAPETMGLSPRGELLDAAVDVLLAEPDLQPREAELAKLRQGMERWYTRGEIPPLPDPHEDLVAHLGWWEMVTANADPGPDDAREDLVGLAVMCVAYDDAAADYPNRLPRVRRLLEGGRERPYLISELALLIPRRRREELSALLCRGESAGFALAVIDQMILEEGPEWVMLESGERTTALEERRTRIWHMALSFWTHVQPSPAAVADLLLALAEQSESARRRVLQPRPEAVRGIEARYRALAEASQAAGLLSSDDVWVQTFRKRLDARRDDGIPTAELRVLAEFAGVDKLSRTACSTIADVYVRAMRARHEWANDDESIAGLPWAQVWNGLSPDARLQVLRPDDLGARASALWQAKAAREHDYILTPRVRLHLRVLAQLLSAQDLPSREDVEQAFVQLLELGAQDDATRGSIGVFELRHEYPYINVGQTPLWPRILAVANKASPALRDRVLGSVIPVTTDLAVLLVALKEIVPEAWRRQVEQRLAAFDVHAFLKTVHWIPHFQVVASAALESAQLAVLGTVLDYGDRIAPKHEEWLATAARIRLALAATGGDALPEDPSASASRPFFEAVRAIRNDPQRARDLFNDLLRTHPQPQIVALNRFAAELHIAARTTAPSERRDKYSAALRDWRATLEESHHAPPDAQFQRTVALNELIALHGAEDRTRYDGRWAEIPKGDRFEQRLAQLHTQTLIARGDLAGAAAWIDEVAAHHGTAAAWIGELRDHVRVSASRQAAAPGVGSSVVAAIDLTAAWRQIRGARIHELARIIEDCDIDRFFFLSHHDVLVELLVRVGTVEALTNLDENKINDVVVSLLRVRLAVLGLDVRDQPRGGRSDTGTSVAGTGGVGERDWVITSRGVEVAIGEAFWLRSLEKPTIDKHLGKLCKYNSTGAAAFVVAYTKADDFNRLHQDYAAYMPDAKFGDSEYVDTDSTFAREFARSTLRIVTTRHRRNGLEHFIHHFLLDFSLCDGEPAAAS